MFQRPRQFDGREPARFGGHPFALVDLLVVIVILGTLAAVIVWAASRP